MRRQGISRKTVTATPRQLESLIRISEAFAKMRLSKEVSVDDVDMAFNLIKDALQQSATDPLTGLIDMDVIVTGHTSASKKRVDNIVTILMELFQANATDFLNKKIGFDRCVD
jgi:DNA replication licensing factor MCM4